MNTKWLGWTLLIAACGAETPGADEAAPSPDGGAPGLDAGGGDGDGAGDGDGDGDGEGDGGKTEDSVCDGAGPDVVLCDDFLGSTLDVSKWWLGRKHWGPPPPRNHGVAPENVSVHGGRAFFAANGDLYSGPVAGVRKDDGYHQDQPGSRSGGILVSDAYLGSGRYEVRMKLPPVTGVCSALWTFHYQEVYEGQPDYDAYVAAGNVPRGNPEDGQYVIANHEIDIEIPTSLEGRPDSEASYQNARYNTWIGETGPEFTDSYVDNGADFSDGEFHVFRFDWYSGGGAEPARVEYYVDGELKHTNTTHVPYIAGRLTLGTWFPEWAGGDAPYDVQYLEVDWVKVTKLDQPNDRFVPESYPDDGLFR